MAISDTSLTEVFGISDVFDHQILGQAGDVTRFQSADHFASYTGTAPIEASSGPIVHIASRERQPPAQPRPASTPARDLQAIHPNPSKTYYHANSLKPRPGKKPLRCLKQQIAKTVYRVLLADHERLHRRGGLT